MTDRQRSAAGSQRVGLKRPSDLRNQWKILGLQIISIVYRKLCWMGGSKCLHITRVLPGQALDQAWLRRVELQPGVPPEARATPTKQSARSNDRYGFAMRNNAGRYVLRGSIRSANIYQQLQYIATDNSAILNAEINALAALENQGILVLPICSHSQRQRTHTEKPIHPIRRKHKSAVVQSEPDSRPNPFPFIPYRLSPRPNPHAYDRLRIQLQAPS